jgi:hypothetical protein
MILTGGEWCLMPGSATAHPMVSSAAGAAHAVPDARVEPGAHAPQAQDIQHTGHTRHGPHAPSTEGARESAPGAPSAPAHHTDGAGCESQAACSIAIPPATRLIARGGSPPHVLPTIESSARPRSHGVAPELPPPRA